MRFPLGLILSLSVLACPLVTLADPSTAAHKAIPCPLIIVAEKGLTTTAPSELTWDFGRRKVTSDAVLTHTFTLRNTGKAPIVIDTLLTSCRCTSAALTRHGIGPEDGGTPLTLQPGMTTALRVDFNSAMDQATEFRKMVWVYVKGSNDPMLTLTITGKLD